MWRTGPNIFLMAEGEVELVEAKESTVVPRLSSTDSNLDATGIVCPDGVTSLVDAMSPGIP